MQKHLEMYPDEELTFKHYINENINKAKKSIRVIRKLRNFLPLLTIYDSFARLHLDYSKIIYDQTANDSLSKKIETVQYNASLAITGAIRGTSKE